MVGLENLRPEMPNDLVSVSLEKLSNVCPVGFFLLPGVPADKVQARREIVQDLDLQP